MEENPKEENPMTLDEIANELVEAAKNMPPENRGSFEDMLRKLKTPVGALIPKSKQD